ncbi:MAG TPA: hypothetical protein VI386_18500 [Candidatus Sulfotelmatobacter sp.]
MFTITIRNRWATMASIVLFSLASLATVAQDSSEIGKQLAAIDNPPADAPVLKTKDRVEQAFDNCIQANSKTEFDTPETLLDRAAKAPCRFGGATVFRGRGDEVLGDILQYDASREVIYWTIPLKRLENLYHGLEGASAYDLQFRKKEADHLSGDQKKEIKTAGESDYLLIPLYGDHNAATTYEGTNALGAKREVAEVRGVRYSIAVNVGKKFTGYGEAFPIAKIAVPREKAAQLMPFLDVKLYWLSARPCNQCVYSGSVVRGTLAGPTFTSPYDIKVLHKFVFAKLVAVRFVDRRDGTTVAISTGN